MKDKKKCFVIDDPGYEPEAVAVQPGGSTVAVGGLVRLFSLKLLDYEHKIKRQYLTLFEVAIAKT